MGLIKKTKRKIRRRISADQYLENLKQKGIMCGGGVRIFDPSSTKIDTQNPHMLKIGNNVRITSGVIILTHDYSWSVLAGVYGECLGGIGYVEIGDNVFIGVNSIVLKDTIIGDNVIIGAGSVVKGIIEGNSVYAGNPARKIMDLEEFYNKKKNKCLDEAKNIVQHYRARYGNNPDEKELQEYFWLFASRKEDLNEDSFGLMERTGYADLCNKIFLNSKPQYECFKDFLESIPMDD